MKIRPRSVRARLTLWHAGVLMLIVCIFSAGILLFVRARLYAALDAQLDREIATIGKVYRDEPDELRDLASNWGITLFHGSEKGCHARCKQAALRRRGLGRGQTAVAIASIAFLNRPIALRPRLTKPP